MKIRLPAAYALALILALVAPGCGSNSSISPSQLWSGTVESLPVVGKDSSLELHSVRSIRTIKVHRVAVMPIIDHPNATGEAIEDGAAESLTADVWGRMTLVSGWEVVPESDVRGVMQQLPPTTLANMQDNAMKLGRQRLGRRSALRHSDSLPGTRGQRLRREEPGGGGLRAASDRCA